MTFKEQAQRVVESLPDDATSDDLVYRVYVQQKVATGLTAVREGRVTDHEEVKRRFGQA